VTSRYDLVLDPVLADVVREIAAEVAAAYNAPRGRYHLYLVRSPEVNAFITPGGDIFLYSGQLTELRSRDELAGVLAHEMAHLEADHFTRISRKASLVLIPAIAAMIVAGGQEAVVASALAIAQAYQLHFSREMESEADRRAVNALGRTRFDRLGLLGAMEVIQRNQNLLPQEVPSHLSTHPVMESRLAFLESLEVKPPGPGGYRPAADPAWERVRAIAEAVTREPYQVLEAWRDASGRTLAPRERHLWGLRLLLAGHPRLAVETAGPAAETCRGDARCLEDLGAMAYRAGDTDRARSLLEESLRADPGGAQSHYLLGEMALDAGDRERAIQHLGRAVELRPEIPEAFHRYGSVVGGEGGRGEGLYYLGTAALLDGRFGEAAALLARAKKALGGDPVWRERIAGRLAGLE
jgi:predicted Zn-dependent protease